MALLGMAPRTTHVPASQTDSAIESDASIYVYNLVVEGTSTGQVIIEEADGSTVILKASVLANTSWSLGGAGFLAPRGINVTTPAGVTCTVLHSGPGA